MPASGPKWAFVLYVARHLRMSRLTFILVVLVNASCATEPVCAPIERCHSIDGGPGDEVCEWIGPKDGPKAYTEHPDGLQIRSDGVTDADLEFLKSAVTLECYEYVFRVQKFDGILFVTMGRLERGTGYRGFKFKRNGSGKWELDGGGFVANP